MAYGYRGYCHISLLYLYNGGPGRAVLGLTLIGCGLSYCLLGGCLLWSVSQGPHPQLLFYYGGLLEIYGTKNLNVERAAIC